MYIQQMLRKTNIKSNSKKTHTILTLGDSYTVGGNGRWEENYPSQLQKMLTERYPDKYAVINGGVCESNSTQILKYFQKLNKAYDIDTVILLVGAANKFNPAGFSDSPIVNFFYNLRIVKMARIFIINLKGVLIQKKVENRVKKQFNQRLHYAFNKTKVWENEIEFCTIEELSELKGIKNKKTSENVNIDLKIAKCYIDQGEHQKAKQLYQKVIDVSPNADWAYEELGSLYYYLGNYQKALNLYLSFLKRDPSKIWVYIKLADFYMENNQNDQAKLVLDQALLFEGNHPEIYEAMGRYYEKRGLYIKTLEMYQQAVEQGFDVDVDAYTELAWAHIRLGNFEDSIQVLLKAIELYPKEFVNYYFLLQAQSLQSKYDAEYILEFFEHIKLQNLDLGSNAIYNNYVHFLKSREVLDKEVEKWLESDLEKIVQICKINGINLIIQNYPYTFLSANHILKNIAKRHSLDFVDNYKVFSSFPVENKEMYFSDFEHCTALGHRIMAQNVYRQFINLYK